MQETILGIQGTGSYGRAVHTKEYDLCIQRIITLYDKNITLYDHERSSSRDRESNSNGNLRSYEMGNV